MELKQNRLKFQIYGNLAGINRIDHGYGVKAGHTQNGSAFKNAKFDAIVTNEDGSTEKYLLNIRGYEREQVSYWDTELKQVGRVPWQERFGLPDNQRLFPIPYDAATNVEMADEGQYFFLSGELQCNPFEDRNGVRHNSIELACDTANEIFNSNVPSHTVLKGDFVFNCVDKEKNMIHGFLINYKGEVNPISFLWGQNKKLLETIGNTVKFGTICYIRNGYIGKELVANDNAQDTPKSSCDFGELGNDKPVQAQRSVTRYVIVGMDYEREKPPYTAEQLGQSSGEVADENDDDLF